VAIHAVLSEVSAVNVIDSMTPDTILGDFTLLDGLGMARVARGVLVCTPKRELRLLRMVEARRAPGRWRVAIVALLTETSGMDVVP